MAYRAASIANELLDLANGRKLTQIEIQKIVYFVHGWYLAYKHAPLIGEFFEPWKYGPVVRSLYDSFKRFGSDAITSKATTWQTDPEGNIVERTPSIKSNDPQEDSYVRSLTRSVWDKYGTLAPFRLVEVTHIPNGPWALAYAAKQTYISNESIEHYFATLIPKARTDA